MRVPGWIELTPAGVHPGPNGTMVQMVKARVRRWHPGFWLFALRTLLRPAVQTPGEVDE